MLFHQENLDCVAIGFCALTALATRGGAFGMAEVSHVVGYSADSLDVGGEGS